MVTSRDAAIEMADERLQEQVQPLIDKLEETIKKWLGPPGSITLNIVDIDDRVIAILKEMYEAGGWTVTVTTGSSTYRAFQLR